MRQKQASLTQYFEAPDNFTGLFGWVCGYSADAAFMNEAIERFTRQSQAQRAYMGQAALALLLDPGNSHIPFVAAPGVVHLGIKDLASKPFVLLHAKVALLGFRDVQNPSEWLLRLIVSTGNWTRQTLENSLDLVWCVDVSSKDLLDNDGASAQTCADIKAAADLFGWLKTYFDTRLLEAAPVAQGLQLDAAPAQFDEWMGQVIRRAKRVKPRFFTNIRKSLLSQLPELVNQAGANPAGQAFTRNYLAMGSGFYEAATDSNADKVPDLLQKIRVQLRQENLLTLQPEIDVFVNPEACQAVAGSVPALMSGGFTVRPAMAPHAIFGDNAQRFLHAKFIFSASSRQNSNNCHHAWLYLGSGNLTGPGFGNKASASGGNLEAGVVFGVPELRWKHERGNQNATPVVTDFLPMQWDTEFSAVAPLSAGAGMDERDVQFVAAPVAWLYWCVDATGQWLQVPAGAIHAFTVLATSGVQLTPDAALRISWTEPRPKQVLLAWTEHGKSLQSSVPVLDETGRIAGADLPQIDLDQAWWQLANFPLPPDDDDIDGQIEDLPIGLVLDTQHQAKRQSSATYPVRQMMELIENIADKQTSLSKMDWPAWCVRLAQCLLQAKGSPQLQAFAEFGINPLSPLWQVPFRPDFAEDSSSAEGQRYEALLLRLEQAWNVSALGVLGDLGKSGAIHA